MFIFFLKYSIIFFYKEIFQELGISFTQDY